MELPPDLSKLPEIEWADLSGSDCLLAINVSEEGAAQFQRVKAQKRPVVLPIAVGDQTTDLTAATNKKIFRMPFAMTLTAVRASVSTAPTGADLIVDINDSGTSVLSTKLTIDAGEKTSTTAAAPAVISDAALADDAEISIDIDQIGSSAAGKGLNVTLYGYRTVA